MFRDQLRSKVVGDVDIDAKTRLELHSQKDGSEPRRTSRDRVLCRSRKYPAHYPELGFWFNLCSLTCLLTCATL